MSRWPAACTIRHVMTPNPSDALPQDDLQDHLLAYPRLQGSTQPLEYLGLSMLVLIAVLASANAIHLRVGGLFVGAVLPMLKP